MQVASSAYSSLLPHSHYHSYYQLHPPGPQDHELKRRYLALLPPQQIIDICLTFDIHVPPYIKSAIWPPDINSAIAALQKATQQPPAEHPVEEPSKDVEPAVMGSLKSPPPHESTPTVQDVVPSTEPQPPDKETNGQHSDPSTSPDAPANETPASPAPQDASDTSPAAPEPAQSATTPTAPTTATAPPPMPPAQPQYPHQPYGYAHHPQATYPISPYYAQPPGGYSYPYGPYANPMQNAYHPQPPAAYPPQPSIYNSLVPISHPAQQQQQQQQQQDGMGGDDLPSYEEMIVEALTGCADPEGWAPKDLFSWMASRYPLQSNFRPSASQALQKAFKRGRFEKSSNGKYRLNPTWEGGNTTRRTTRRPQTQNSQSTPSTTTPAPPFTHAPLVHHHHGHPSASSQPAPQQPYPSQPFGYPPYSHVTYPGYPPQPNASTSTAPGTIAGAPTSSPMDKTSAAAAAAAPVANPESDSADAYEAAKNILSAINFTNMYQLPPEEQHKDGQRREENTAGDGSDALTDNGVEQLLSHVQAMLASNAAPQSAPPSMSTGMPHSVNDGSVEDPRAELQAQLALLAAQLAELGQVEETASLVVQNQPAPFPPPSQVASDPPPPPPITTADAVQIHAPTPIMEPPRVADISNDDIPEPMPEDDDSDDEDMEEII